MSLLADLRHGRYGIQFNPPPLFALEVDKDTFASFRDEDHRVDWYLEYSPLIVDVSPSQEEILRADLHLDTTAVFESCFESSRHRQDSSAGTERPLSLPRTKREPTWSPVISVHRITLGGVPALQVIYRMAYAPGDELIIGRMILPLAQGTVYLSALRRAEVTGIRESVLAITTLPSAEEGDQPTQIAQAAIDAPDLDEKFPDHPLSVIRRALQWALTAPLELSVTAPLPLECPELVELPTVGCAIRRPPRFRFCPKMAEATGPSVAPFIRTTVPQTGSYTFDVWRAPSIKLTGHQAMQQLRHITEDNLRGWKREGEADVEIETVELPLLEGRPLLRTVARFTVNGQPNHAVANWFIDHDGAVFRICAAGAVSRSREELTTVVTDSTRSWTRLPGDLKSRAKWWKVFSQ